MCPPFGLTWAVSRITWRVGERYWLSQSEPARTPALLRQADLLQRLQSFLRSEQLPISVPEIVAANSGNLVVAYRANGWCLTRHLEGRHPDSRDPATYPALAEGLARFHVALRLFAERDRSNVPDGICVKTRKNIDRLHCAHLSRLPMIPGSWKCSCERASGYRHAFLKWRVYRGRWCMETGHLAMFCSIRRQIASWLFWISKRSRMIQCTRTSETSALLC